MTQYIASKTYTSFHPTFFFKMFGIRTPAKRMNVTVDIESESPAETSGTGGNVTYGVSTPVEKPTANLIDLDEKVSPPRTEQAGPSKSVTPKKTQTSNVRRSIGEWETGKASTASASLSTVTSPKKPLVSETTKPKTKKALSQESKGGVRKGPLEASSPREKVKYLDRIAEAKACVTKAKLNLGNARNLKTEIKVEVLHAIDRLYQLVKEVESVKATGKKDNIREPEKDPGNKERTSEDNDLKRQLEEHSKLLRDNNERMENLKEKLEEQKVILEKTTYANVAAGPPRRQSSEQAALHSVVVYSKDETETGEEVLNRIRGAMNAKEGGIKVDKVRKAKDRKIIMGCRTEAEREKVKERLKRAETYLTVEEIKNKDPLLILRDVLQFHSDEDIANALRNQNGSIFQNLEKKDNRFEVRYRKKARNPHTCHIVIRASPKIWNLMMEAGEVHIDLQRVRVSDQTPLVQCSLCLGYGHGRRQCKESIEKCSHCGGPHMRTDCADWLSGAAPSCCNCQHAKLDSIEHNAFSQECPVRRKWDALARASVAYC